MKKIIIIIISLFCLSAARAQQIEPQVPNEKSPAFYCAKMKDGILVLVNEGKEVFTDVILSNGSKITTDCTLIRADGTSVKLESDQCVSPEGNIVKPVKAKKEEKNKRNSK